MTERLKIPLYVPRPWTARAACRNHPTRLFYPTDGRGKNNGAYEPARAVCHTCPVIDDCLQWALTTPEPFGMWGGLDPDERRTTRRQRRRSA